MFAMLAAFFRMFEKLFSAGEKGCTALDNVATVTVLMSESYVSKAVAENQIQNINIKKEIAAAKAA